VSTPGLRLLEQAVEGRKKNLKFVWSIKSDVLQVIERQEQGEQTRKSQIPNNIQLPKYECTKLKGSKTRRSYFVFRMSDFVGSKS